MSVITSMVSDWEMDASGNAIDSHSTNDLTETSGTIALVASSRLIASGDTEYFERASNAALQTGDIDFSFELWFQPTVNGQSMVLIGKDIDTPANARDYALGLDLGTPRFYINGGGGGLIATWGSQITSGAGFYQLLCGHSAASNELWITINNGTPVTTGTSGAVPEASASSPFRIGAMAYASFEGYADGYFKRARMWKRDIRTDATWLYNSGSGRSYADIVAEAGTTAPLPVFMNQYRQRWR